MLNAWFPFVYSMVKNRHRQCVCVYIGLNIALVPIFSACIVVHTEIGTKKSNKIYTDAIYLFIVIYFHSK